MKQNRRSNPRVAGLLFVVISLVLAKFSVIDVITAAQAHAHNVEVSMKGVSGSIFFFLLGMFFLFGGPLGSSLLIKKSGKSTLTPLGYLLVLGCFGAGVVGYNLFKQYIASFGYKL